MIYNAVKNERGHTLHENEHVILTKLSSLTEPDIGND